MSFFTMIFVGNLGKDPEMKYTPGGQAVTNMNVCVDRTYPNAQGVQVKEVTWLRVATWGKSAESCSTYLKKGSKVLVEGRLVPGKDGYPRVFNKTDGTSGSSYEVNASVVRFMDGKREGEAVVGEVAVVEEDIPFTA